jgi:hypothetical protein
MHRARDIAGVHMKLSKLWAKHETFRLYNQVFTEGDVQRDQVPCTETTEIQHARELIAGDIQTLQCCCIETLAMIIIIIW